MKTITIAVLVLCLATLGSCAPEPTSFSIPNPQDDQSLTEALRRIAETNAEIISPGMYGSDMPRMTALLERIVANQAVLQARSERFEQASEALLALIEARQTGPGTPLGLPDDCVPRHQADDERRWSDGMSLWIPIRDCDSRAVRLYRRHYSAPRRRDWFLNQRITGPGEYLRLLTPGADALFAWRVFMEVHRDKPVGVNCSIFRNEADYLSSELILEAEGWARRRWPDMEWLYTYVNPRMIRSSNPGCCFKAPGWRPGEPTQRGLLSLWGRRLEVDRVVGEAEALPHGL